MTIAFRCPNGHKLSCPAERAGQAGKCPKCGATFHVPSPDPQVEEQLVGAAVSDEAAVGGGVGSGVNVSSGSSPDSGSAPNLEDAPEGASAEHPDNIVFLCPNGHKLNAPVRMQGKPGKCPHCGEKFLVPLLDDAGDETESGNFFDMVGDSGASASQEEHPPEQPSHAQESGFNFGGFAAEDEFTAGLIESSSQAMATLFERLWHQRGETGVVELYLKGGEILSPHWYAPQLSQHAYGMFAFQEQDGSHTLTAVHWEAIERIALRGLPQLPEGVFET